MGLTTFLTRHVQVLQSGAALVTALAAVLALIVVPWKIAATERVQQAQSARDIYRDFLNLTVQKPEVAGANLCSNRDANLRTAYEAYVDHLLYTAEQVLDVSEEWALPMQAQIDKHQAHICSWTDADLAVFSDPVLRLLQRTRQQCAAVTVCP